MKTIEERIVRILLDDFKVARETVDPDRTFAECGFDSLVIVELSLVLDSEFGLGLADGELTDEMTITAAAALVAAKGADS
jgi:acyl carrier protein